MSESTLQIFNSILYLIGTVGIFLVLIIMFRQIKANDRYDNYIAEQFGEIDHLINGNHQDVIAKLASIHEALKDIQHNLKIVDGKVNDFTMRINIAEVRLEERKAQQLMIPAQVQQLPAMPRRAGRKPRATSNS